MLTQDDLQAIATLINASEERMKNYVDGSLHRELATSEERMKNYVDGSLHREITASEERMKNHMNAVIETQVVPQIRQIADGHLQLSEQLGRVESRLDSLEETVAAHEWYIVRKTAES